MDRGLSTFLDAARWIAALVVLVGHVAGLMFHETRGFAETSEPLELIAYCLIKVGHYAVMVFFVISGYLVGGITLRRWMKSGPNLADYAVARVSRIYTVLLPALVVGMTFDLLGLRFFSDSALYTGELNNISLHKVSTRIGVEEFALNLGMLQGMYVEALGSNGPLWSLAYEWWYYGLFAAIAGAIFSKGWMRYGLVAVSLVLVYGMTSYMLIWSSIWLMGLVAYFVIPKVRAPHPLIGLAVLIGALIWACYTANPDYRTAPEPMWMNIGRDAVVGIAFCFAMACFRGSVTVPGERLHKWAAQFSYTTYLFHFPAMLLLGATAHHVFGLPVMVKPTLVGFAYVAIFSAILFAMCCGFYWIAERHTDKVRQGLNEAASAVLRFARA